MVLTNESSFKIGKATTLQTVTLAQRVYAAVRSTKLSDTPVADLTERLSLLTVAGELRRIGAIGFAESNNEGKLRRLRDLLVDCGLKNKITDHPPAERGHLLDQFSP